MADCLKATGGGGGYTKNNVDLASCATGYLLVTQAEYSQLLATSTSQPVASNPDAATFDYSLAASFWGFAFITTLTLWLVAKNGGIILSLIRR